MRDPFLKATEPARTIDEVITHIDEVIDVARKTNSRMGYFAALYRHVAVKFKAAAAGGTFKHPELIDKLDVTFINRYLQAIRQYQQGETPSKSWAVAFTALESSQPTVVQHLLMGMNAHINFDLGIAVADSCTQEELALLHDDFEKMNTILGSLLEDVESDLAQIWPLLKLIHRLVGRTEDAIINFSMRETRALAWRLANRLAGMDKPEREKEIQKVDQEVANIGSVIAKPFFPMNLAMALVRLGERGSVRQVIDTLLKSTPINKETGKVEKPGNHLSNTKRKKVVILGGGVSAMTTAFELTDPKNPNRDRYDITVYQLGWRLGGKGASGRNIDHQYRIEEHGLHIWFGCYDNAFRVIRECYAELDRTPDAPLATWEEAFKPHSEIVLKEHVNGEWINWLGGLPPNNLVPGDGAILLPLWDYVIMAIKWIVNSFGEVHPSPTGDVDLQLHQGVQDALDSWASNLESSVVNDGLKLIHGHHLGTDIDTLATKLERHSTGLAAWIGKEIEHFHKTIDDDIHGLTHELVVKILGTFVHWFWADAKNSLESSDNLRRLWILCNFIYANIRGGIEDGILFKGFDAINDYDYRDWLKKYAYDDNELMLNSAWVLGTYDAMFAYVNGDNRIPEGELWPPNAKLEAGTVMKAGIRQFLAYKGASVWKMQAGMGDTIFGPVYEVLKKRGVKFNFFHRVQDLVPSTDGKSVDKIKISRQVTVKPEQEAYDPFIDVKGLPCWPSTPNYSQLVEGEALQREGVNLEDYATPWKDIEEIELTKDKDFDLVVMGISIGALPYIAGDLIKRSTKWQNMIKHVKTIRTQAVQLWLKPTAYELGWKLMQRPIVTGYDITPIDTWADMSHLIERESWPVSHYPLNISYFCGPMLDEEPLPMTETGPRLNIDELNQTAADDKVKLEALRLFNDLIGPFCMPNALISNDGGKEKMFNWNLVVDPAGNKITGQDRFASQYIHANVMPSERYVLSVPGSSKHRLPANDPDEFANMYLTGDWTDNGFNLGCVESATMSGLLASNAISGYPKRDQIIGLDL
jgi:uncharacterized protein with NAD-binding domain and iron-sulfur cluster